MTDRSHALFATECQVHCTSRQTKFQSTTNPQPSQFLLHGGKMGARAPQSRRKQIAARSSSKIPKSGNEAPHTLPEPPGRLECLGRSLECLVTSHDVPSRSASPTWLAEIVEGYDRSLDSKSRLTNKSELADGHFTVTKAPMLFRPLIPF